MVLREFFLQWMHLVQIERPLSPSSDSMAERMLSGLVWIEREARSRCCSELEMFQRILEGLVRERRRLSW